MHVRLAILFIALFSSALCAEEASSGVTFVLAADMPNISDERSGNYPQLRTLVTQYREQSSPTFFVFGGGSIGPSALSSFDRGSHIVDILNSIEPDVMGVTKREFSFYEDELSLRSYEAAFPLVTSNVISVKQGRAPDGIHTSVIIEQSGVSLGVISILHDRVINEYQLSDLSIEPPQKAIIEKAKALRQRGADIVLLHYSYPFRFIDTLLSKNVVDVAFISDSRVTEKQLEEESQNPRNLKMAGVGYAVVAHVVQDKNKGWTVSQTRDVDLSALVPDPQLKEQVYGYESRLKRLLNIQIGEWRVEHSTNRTEVRTAENAFANFVVDTVRDYAKTDVVLLNGGSIRGNKNYEVGMSITRQDIVTEMPFRANVVTLKLTGEQLLLALEQGLSQFQDIKGGFPHVSGMTYTFDSSAKPFSRVGAVKVAGKPLRYEKMYSLATSDFLANGGDGYFALKEAARLNAQSARPPQIADLVVQRIANEYDISPPVTQRIVDTAKGR
jgi:2',3'-cyclic-nucleotide 2'-phosphodiesterase (5'-nucleotidase family)